MAATSYKIRGIAPPTLAARPPAERQQFWAFVVEIGLKVKDRELAAGLDREGKPLRPISAATRKHRHSAMTPDGRGSPSAPPLMPAYELSRTRSLLAGRALPTHADFYWRFDPFTGDSWGKVLAIQARKGRDVIGLSAKGIAEVKRLAWAKWAAHEKSPLKQKAEAASAPPGIPQVGSYSTEHATFGVGGAALPKFLPGRSTGGLTYPEARRYFTQPNPTPVIIPGRPEGLYNRILAHIFGRKAG